MSALTLPHATADRKTQPILRTFRAQLKGHPMAMKFDNTVNAGHILSAGAMLVAGALAYATLSGRIGVLEDRDVRTQLVQAERVLESKETLREIKSDIKDLQRGVNEISRAVAQGQGVGPGQRTGAAAAAGASK